MFWLGWLATATGFARPLVDVPLTRLQIPKGAVGRDLLIVAVELSGKREEFVLDTGTTCELITPELAGFGKKEQLKAVTPGGKGDFEMMELTDARLDGVALGPLHAVVAAFPFEHVDPDHSVRGILGLEFMRRFDVDIDCPAKRFRLWRTGEGKDDATRQGMQEVPCFDNGGMLATRVAAKNDAPFIAMVDTGSSMTVLTTAAAHLVDAAFDEGGLHRGVVGMGVDAKPTALPLLEDVRLDLVGVDDALRYDVPTGLRAAVGDLGVFKLVFGDDIGSGPTAILGMDLWDQGRTLFCGHDHLGGTALFWGTTS